MELLLNPDEPTKVAERIFWKYPKFDPNRKANMLHALLNKFYANKDLHDYFSEERESRFYEHIMPVLLSYNYSFMNRDNSKYSIHMKLLAVGLIFSKTLLDINVTREHNRSTILILYRFMNQLIKTGMDVDNGLGFFYFNFDLYMRDNHPQIRMFYFDSKILDLCRKMKILFPKAYSIHSFPLPSFAPALPAPVDVASPFLPKPVLQNRLFGLVPISENIPFNNFGLNPFIPPLPAGPPPAPVAEKPVPAPVVEKAVVAPAMDEPVLASVVEKAVVAPAMDESVSASVVEKAVVAPAMDEPVVAPAMDEAVLASVVEKPALAPVQLYRIDKIRDHLNELITKNDTLKRDLLKMEGEFAENKQKLRRLAGV